MTESPQPPAWGPERRRAAVALAFDGLAAAAPGHVVTPALPTLLRVLGDRDLPATFFVERAIAAGEQMALTMVELGGHEIATRTADGALAGPAADLRYRAERGAATAHADELRDDDGLVRVPIALDDADGAPPAVLHRTLQAAVGATLARGGLLVVLLTPSRFERRDALDVLVESADLVAGLRRAERVWTPLLSELAASERPG